MGSRHFTHVRFGPFVARSEPRYKQVRREIVSSGRFVLGERFIQRERKIPGEEIAALGEHFVRSRADLLQRFRARLFVGRECERSIEELARGRFRARCIRPHVSRVEYVLERRSHEVVSKLFGKPVFEHVEDVLRVRALRSRQRKLPIRFAHEEREPVARIIRTHALETLFDQFAPRFAVTRREHIERGWMQSLERERFIA